MSRIVAGVGAAVVATALILGPLRTTLMPSARAQLPDAAAASQDHAVAAASPAPAVAAAVPGPNAARVALAARPADKITQGYLLSVALAGPDAKPLNETAVSFYQVVDLFGRREMYLGQTTTDGQGAASFIYLPAQLGPREIVARSARKGAVTFGEARMTLDAQIAAAPYRVEPPSLAAFSAVLPYGVGAILLAVWSLLAFALIGTARGVLDGARDHAQRKGDLA